MSTKIQEDPYLRDVANKVFLQTLQATEKPLLYTRQHRVLLFHAWFWLLVLLAIAILMHFFMIDVYQYFQFPRYYKFPSFTYDLYSTPLVYLVYLKGAIIFIRLQMQYYGREFLFTSERIVYKFGLLKREISSQSYSDIKGIDIKQGILGQLCDYGHIIVTDISLERTKLYNMPTPYKILQLIETHQTTTTQADAGSPPTHKTIVYHKPTKANS